MFAKKIRKGFTTAFIIGAVSLVCLLVLPAQAKATDLIVGTWGAMALQRENSGIWYSESSRITFNIDGSGSIVGTKNDESNAPGNRIKTFTEYFTYTAALNADGSYALTINFTGDIKNIRVVFSDNGNMAILDGTYDSNRVKLSTLVRIDPAKNYTNSDVAGAYYSFGYERNVDGVVDPPNGNGSFMAISSIHNFSGTTDGQGAGTYTYAGKANSVYADGHNGVWDDTNARVRSYTVNPDGTMTVGGGAFLGTVSGNGNVFGGTGSYLSNNWMEYFFMKKRDRAYATADLAGKWAIVSLGQDSQAGSPVSFDAQIGTMECDSAGACSFKLRDRRSDGSSNISTGNVTLSVADDGSFGEMLAGPNANPKPPAYAGAIGNNGNTILFNTSFDPAETWHREIFIGVRASAVGDLAEGTAASNTVTGNVTYSGSKTGNIKVKLWSADMSSGNSFETTLSAPGVFTFNTIPIGRYYAGAFRDSDNNGAYTTGEAYGYRQDASGLQLITLTGSGATGITIALADPAATPTGASVAITSNLSSSMTGYLVFFRQGDSLTTNSQSVISGEVTVASGLNNFQADRVNRPYDGMPVPAGTYDFYFMTGDLANGPNKGVVQGRQMGVTINRGSVTTLNPITFNAGGTVSGRVTSSASDNPLLNVRVGLGIVPDLAHPENFTLVAWGKTDQNGNFVFEHVPMGNYYLNLIYTGYTFIPVAVNVTSNGQTVSIPEAGTKLTPTQTPGTVSGTLTPSGAGVDSRVILKSGETVLAQTTPATDGAYTITDVIPGTYTLIGSARGYVPQQASVTVAAGANTRNLTLSSTKQVILNGVNWLLDHQRTDGSFDDNLSGDAHQFVFGWTGYAGLTLLSVYENPKYSDAASLDYYIGDALKAKINDALYGIVSGETVTKKGIKQYFEGTYHATDDTQMTPGWDDTGAFFNDTVAWSSVAATPVALEKLIALGVPLSDPKIVNSVKFLLNAQVTAAKTGSASSPFNGGWRYNPNNTDSDNWETAWVIMALMKAGVNPTAQAVSDGVIHIKRSQVTGTGWNAGLFRYQPGTDGAPLGTSAACVLALNFAGEPRTSDYIERFFQWTKSNGDFSGFSRYADAYWWSMFPWAAILYDDPDKPGKKMYDTLALTWNMADEIVTLQQGDGRWINNNYTSGGSNSGNAVMYTASALMAIAPYAGLAPRPPETTIAGTVKNPSGQALANAKVEAVLDGVVRASYITANGAYTLSVPQNYAYTVRVTAAGYVRTSITTANVGTGGLTGQDIAYQTSDVDTAAPTVTGLTPANGTMVYSGRPEISAVLTDFGSGGNTPAGIDPATIAIKLNGNGASASYNASTGVVSFIHSQNDLPNATYTVTVDVKDYAGNAATQASWSFTVSVYHFPRTPVTSGTDSDNHPAWSPDGQWIVFDSNRGGNDNIWKVQLDGMGLTQLTTSAFAERYPSWSPDGTKIAYILHDPDPNPIEGAFAGFFLYTMNADGTGKTLHPLPPRASQDQADQFWEFDTKFTVWLDATHIAFVSFGPEGGSYKIYRYDLSNSTVVEITPAGEANPIGDVAKLSWSAATNLLAYDRWPIGIHTFTPGTANLQVVNIPRANQMDTPAMAGWNPTGTKLAFVKSLYMYGNIGIFDLTSGAAIEDQTTTADEWPVWSPDGNKIAIVSDGHIWLLTDSQMPAALKGDINGNEHVTLADAILAMKAATGLSTAGIRANYPASGADVNGDKKVGLQELIYILQYVAGLRQ